MEEAAKLAGFFAAHSMWTLSDMGALMPLLAYVDQDGEQQVFRFISTEAAEIADEAHHWLQENPEEAAEAVLVLDAFVTLSTGKIDAVLLDVYHYAPQIQTFRMAVPYRPANSPRGFAIHRPKFLGFTGPEPDWNAIGQDFFEGVNTHEHGAPIWNRYLDESI